MVVNFKFLNRPKLSRKSILIQRRKRRKHPSLSPKTDGERLIKNDTNQGGGVPKLRKLYVFLFIVLLIVVIILGLLYHYGLFNNGGDKGVVLIPPNPKRPLPLSASILRTFKKAAVCVDAAPCAEIGKQILERNGTAVDATIAAMFCNGIVTMQSMGLGGGFLMTIYIKSDEKAYVLNAREMAPMNISEDFYRDYPKKLQKGPLAVGVPGELRGYWAAHKRFGRLAWKELIEPSIELCEKGFNMSQHQYNALFKANIAPFEVNLREWFLDRNDKFKMVGSRIIPKKLCKTLKIIANNGGDDLYNGTLAKELLQDLNEIGSVITAEDLENYSVEWKEPVTIEFDDQSKLFSVPPPGSGILLGFIMNILDGYNFTRDNISDIGNTVQTYHKIVEAYKYAYARRTELGDLNFVNISTLLANLTSKAYATNIRKQIKTNSTSLNPKDYGAIYYTNDDHGTAHISVLAENGDAVSVTSSVNIFFGAGLTSNRTGILLNSVIDDFSIPNVTNYFNLPGSPNNKLQPHKRPLSSMSPTIIIDKDKDVKMVIGASGGTKITTAIAWVLIRTLWFNDNIKEAIDSARLHHQLYPMSVQYEYGILDQIVKGLEKIGHKTARYSDAGSIICALYRDNGTIFANADFRKGGDVYGIN